MERLHASYAPWPLTSQQKAYWVLHERDNRWNHFDIFALLVSGWLDLDALNMSVETLISRHDALRTRITMIDGAPHQFVEPPRRYGVRIDPLAEVTEDPADSRVKAQLAVEELDRQEPDVAVAPLFSVRAIKLSDQEHVLVWIIHHLIFDLESLNLMFRDFWALYSECLSGTPPSLANVPFQYSDYGAWQRKAIGPLDSAHADGWRSRLDGATGIEWPGEEAMQPIAQGTVEYFEISLPEELREGLREVARRIPTLLSLLMLTIYIGAVARWCGQSDFVVATMATGRDRREHHSVVGLLSHPIYLRIKLAGNETPLDLLRRVNGEFYRAVLHSDFGETVTGSFGLLRGSLFTWIPWRAEDVFGVPRPDESARAGVRVERFQFAQRPTFPEHLNIEVLLSDTPTIAGGVIYRSNAFERSTIDRFVEEMHDIAERMVNAPDSRIPTNGAVSS